MGNQWCVVNGPLAAYDFAMSNVCLFVYLSLATQYLSRDIFMQLGLDRRSRNWHAACQDRDAWENLCRTLGR